MDREQRDWHRIFGLILTDFFSNSPFRVELEKDLSLKKQLLDVVSHTPAETKGLAAWQSTGFVDAVRHFVPADQKLYTWWSYRNRDWRVSDRAN